MKDGLEGDKSELPELYHMSFNHTDISQARRKCGQQTAYINAKNK